MSVSLITLDIAKAHLRIRHLEQDLEIEQAAQMASALVLAYLEAEENVTGSPVIWSAVEYTVPDDVKAAVLVTLAELWRHAGDQAPAPRGTGGMLSVQAEGYLKMRRNPALA